jgi:hypothetical protein
MTGKLYAASDIAERLKISKQAVHKALNAGRIETPDWELKGVNGWTLEQVERITKTYKGAK